MKKTERCQWRPPDDFIDNLEHVSDVLVFLSLALSMYLFAGIDEYSSG